jgi:hypothetical protein
MLALNEALESLAEIDARQARVVELRYFGGLGDGNHPSVRQARLEKGQGVVVWRTDRKLDRNSGGIRVSLRGRWRGGEAGSRLPR